MNYVNFWLVSVVKWGGKGLGSSKARPTTACSRLATARIIDYTLPAKLVLIGVCRADPQAADAEALGARNQRIETRSIQRNR